MPRKTMLIMSLACLGLAVFAYVQFSEKEQLSAQLDLQSGFRSQLLEQVEVNTQQRLTFRRQIAALENKLSSATNQITNLSQSLQAARKAEDPDLDAIREEIRAQVERELQSPQARVRRYARTMTPEAITQMARTQVNTRYGQFLAELNTNVDRKSQIQEFLVEIVAEQNTMSMRVTAGELDVSELVGKMGADIIEEQLASVLTAKEVEQFEAYLDGNTKRIMRRTSSVSIMLSAPGLNFTSKNLVLDIFVENLDPEKLINIGGGQFSNRGIAFRQLEALEKVRQELNSQLEPDQFRQASFFLDQMRTNYEASAAREEARQGQQ